MRKRTILAAMAAVAVIAFAWSMSTLARPKIAGKEEATEASAPISPHDKMIKQGNTCRSSTGPIRFESRGRRCPELNEVGALGLWAVDHDAVLAVVTAIALCPNPPRPPVSPQAHSASSS